MSGQRDHHGSVLGGAARGALAGAAATLAMDVVDRVLHRLEPESSRRRTREVRPEGKDPPHLFADQMAGRFGLGPFPQEHRAAGTIAYYAIGVGAGALYGALRGRVPGLSAGRGAAFGLGRFVLEDKVFNPLNGLAAAPHRYPWQAHGRQLAALLTHALATDAALRALDGPEPGRVGGPTPDGAPTRSVQGWIAEQLLPLTGMKQAFRSEEALRRDVALWRPKGPALPGAGMRRRLEVTEADEAGMRVFTVRPREGGSRDVILYLHGGAYVHDIMAVQWGFVERLVEATGATIVVPLYPLAPEHNAADVFARMVPLYDRILAQAGPERVTVLGDSAGGGLGLALAQGARKRGGPLPARLVLVSPWLDVTVSDPSQPARARRDRMLDLPGLRAAGRWYAGDLPPHDPRISPLFGSLRGLPPLQVFTGTHDLISPDSRRLRKRAEREGARLRFHEYPGQFHVWPLVDLPESRQAIAQMAGFIAGRA